MFKERDFLLQRIDNQMPISWRLQCEDGVRQQLICMQTTALSKCIHQQEQQQQKAA